MGKKIRRQRQGSKINLSKMMANARALEEKDSHSATSVEPSSVVDPAKTAAVATGDAAVSSPANADLEKDDGSERADHVDSAAIPHDRKPIDDLVETALADGVHHSGDGDSDAGGAPGHDAVSSEHSGVDSDPTIDEETRRLIEEALANAGSPQPVEDSLPDYGHGSEDGEEEWTEEQLKTFDQLEEEDVLADSDSAGAVRVLDNIVVYETENWMNEQTGKPYNRIRLRQQPPTIRFKQHVTGDETGEYDSEVTLVVTRKLAMQLGSLFDAIVASYDGRPIEDKDKQPVTLESVKKWLSDQWKYEPGKVIIVCVLAVLVVILGVYAKFAVR